MNKDDYIKQLEEENKLLKLMLDKLTFKYKNLSDSYGRLKEKYVNMFK